MFNNLYVLSYLKHIQHGLLYLFLNIRWGSGSERLRNPYRVKTGEQYLRSFLLKLLNGPFIDAPALIDEVSGGGGLPGVHMSDDHDVNVELLLPHDGSVWTTQNLV